MWSVYLAAAAPNTVSVCILPEGGGFESEAFGIPNIDFSYFFFIFI
jgi:hypothetical protein